MAWIKLDQSLCKHRKVMCMSDMLDEQDAHIIGHLSLLWIWCLDNAPTGVLPSSNRIISRAAQYLGDADSFFSALETSGLVDINEDGSRSIHDWFDFAGNLIDKRVANRDRMRSARATHNNSTCGKRTGARVEKSRVEKTRVDKKEKQEKEAADEPPDLFSEFWQLYPKKVSKPRALKDFSDQKITQVDMDVIVTQIRDIGNLTAEERKKIPAANIYLKERRWEGNAPFVGLDIYREQARDASLNGRQNGHSNGSTPEQPRPKLRQLIIPEEILQWERTIQGRDWKTYADYPEYAETLTDREFHLLVPPNDEMIAMCGTEPKLLRMIGFSGLAKYKARMATYAAL